MVLILAFASVNTLLMDAEPVDLSRHRRQTESFDFVPEVVEPSEETSLTDSATKQATPSSFLPNSMRNASTPTTDSFSAWSSTFGLTLEALWSAETQSAAAIQGAPTSHTIPT